MRRHGMLKATDRNGGRWVVSVSLHAVDRASLRLLVAWQRDRERGEGLVTWLTRRAAEAVADRWPRPSEHLDHRGLRFTVRESGGAIVVTTVLRARAITARHLGRGSGT